MDKLRLDVLLTKLGLAKSRESAKHMILSNYVYVEDKVVNKPSTLVDYNSKIKIENPNTEYVSRGAYKLEKAVKVFNINLQDKVAVDIGASTGGFTDFMLKNGCRKIYAIDVGHGQLHNSLSNDNRVVSIEKTNFRYIDTKIFTEKIDFISVDVSFISLELIIPKIAEICNEFTQISALVKPQFEAGKGNIGKHGVVKDKKIHVNVLNKVDDYFTQNNLFICNIAYSPIMGGDGNIEYLIYVKKSMDMHYRNNKNEIIYTVVNEAFNNFN